MPSPNSGESRDDFIDRCMSDDEAVNDFPETDQRFAFCNSVWEQNKETNSMKKNKIYKSSFEFKASDEEKREIVAIGSKEMVDRDGDIVVVGKTPTEGININEFKKNPVVLFAHDYNSLPIARAERVWKEDKKLMFKLKFPEPEISSLGDSVYKLMKGNYLNALSIGFSPDWEKAEPNEKTGGFKFNNTTLLEVSVVPVPSNPMSLVQSKSIQKALQDEIIDDAELKEIELYLSELKTEEIPEEIEEKTDKSVSDGEEVQEESRDKVSDREQISNKEESCPHCGRKYMQEDDDNDPFDWLFKEHQADEPKDDTTDDLVDELLNQLNEGDKNG